MSTRFKQLLASLVECEDRVQRESIARQLEHGPETVCEVR
jgi:hypothetical protein